MKSNQILMMGKSADRAANGYLYNWFAASDANFAPTDWKVPTDAEITTLTDYLGGLTVAGGKMKEAGLTHWETPNTSADNSSGFTALPSGLRLTDGSFGYINQINYLWSSTEDDSLDSWRRGIYYNSASVDRNNFSKKYGCSIRLLYTGAGTPTTLTDADGNVYDTVTIGTQIWLKQNWKCTHLKTGTALTKVTDGTAWAALTSEGYCSYNNDDSLT